MISIFVKSDSNVQIAVMNFCSDTINWIDELFAERIFQLQKGGNGDTCHHPSMLVLQKDPYFLPCRGDLTSTMIQGLWTSFVFLNLTLTDRKMQVEFGFEIQSCGNFWHFNQFLWNVYWEPLIGSDQILLRFCPKFVNFPNSTCILLYVRNKLKIKQVRRPCRSSQRLTLLLSVHNQNCSWWNICCTSLLHWQWVIKGKTFIQREHSLPLPWGATGGKMEYKKPSAETRRRSWCAQLPPWYIM